MGLQWRKVNGGAWDDGDDGGRKGDDGDDDGGGDGEHQSDGVGVGAVGRHWGPHGVTAY